MCRSTGGVREAWDVAVDGYGKWRVWREGRRGLHVVMGQGMRSDERRVGVGVKRMAAVAVVCSEGSDA